MLKKRNQKNWIQLTQKTGVWGLKLWVIETAWGRNWPRLLQVSFYRCELKPQRTLFPQLEELLPLPISKNCSLFWENSAVEALREEEIEKVFLLLFKNHTGPAEGFPGSWERPREEFNLQCFCHALLAPAMIHCSPGPRQKGCRDWSDL